MNFLRVMVALILPPMGIFLKTGLSLQFWVNLPLTMMGYIPGIIHALWVILRKPQ